ncbi:MAG: hypothetical protein KBD21_02500 [Candidatus Pacebacteria bacterium]|nr:hypothetical protein [Candidatus Paceibacterota bacterium]
MSIRRRRIDIGVPHVVLHKKPPVLSETGGNSNAFNSFAPHALLHAQGSMLRL